MEKVVHKIRLDLGKMGSQASICVSQGDVKSRRIMFLLYNGAIPYEVTDNLRITFSAVKPDGTMLYDDSSFIISGNVITYLMHEQLTAVVGTVHCELVITDSTGILYSPQFDVYVQDVLITASDITSTSEFTQLNRLLNSWENPVTNVSYGDDVNASVELDSSNGCVNFDFTLPEKLPENTAVGQVLTVNDDGKKIWSSDALTIIVNAVVDESTGNIAASLEYDLEWMEGSTNIPQMATQALEMKRPVYALLKGAANNRTLIVPLTNVYSYNGTPNYAEFSGAVYMGSTAYKAYIRINALGSSIIVQFDEIADADTKLKIVTISGNDTDGYTADMTQSEIQSAINSGSYVVAQCNEDNSRLWTIFDGPLGAEGPNCFCSVYPSGDSFVIDTFTIYNSHVTREIKKMSLKRPRNYVRGFKHATATFNINTASQKIEFAPTSAALIWGDNGHTNIVADSYAVIYLKMTKPAIVDLVYSPDKKMFSFVATATADIAASDYVIMTLYINKEGAINHVVACDDILDRITITDANGTTEYYSTHSLKAEVVEARTAYDGTVHASLYDSLKAQFNKFAQRYRNYARDYNGNISVDITIDSENGLLHITVTPKSTSVIFCDAASYKLVKDTDGHNTMLPLSAYGVYHIMWSSTYGLITADYKAASITEDDIILFTIYIDGFNNVGNIIACDAMLNSIYVNNEKWIAEAVEKETEIPYNQNTCSIFRRVCCIGDSATAGHIDVSDSSCIRRNEAYAWPAFMAKLTGNEYINLGVSGATALSWLDGRAGMTDEGAFFNAASNTIRVKATWTPTHAKDPGIFEKTVENTETISAYIIGLGMNDTLNAGTGNGNFDDGGTGTPKLNLGNESEVVASDLVGFADTFYGKYTEIIKYIHEVSPQAHIFVQTMHDNMNDRREKYNNAIKYIANYYRTRETDPVPVHVLDLNAYKDLYKVDSIRNAKPFNVEEVTDETTGETVEVKRYWGHWAPSAYQQFAEILRRIWSEYINSHPLEFNDICLVPYLDESAEINEVLTQISDVIGGE